jgi:hypothetical protein
VVAASSEVRRQSLVAVLIDFDGDQISRIEAIADPDRLRAIDYQLFDR